MVEQVNGIVPDRLDRVRANTPLDINKCIDKKIENNIQQFQAKSDTDISNRLYELEAEWDIERALESTASTIIFGSCLLTLFVNRKWARLPLIVSGFLLQHAIQGWCPPLLLFRRFGVRTRSEIDAEKYALKAMRGDFEGLGKKNGHPQPDAMRLNKLKEAVAKH